MIKIVVTKYPRDKWYQFNAGNILRIQHREGKAITSISLTVSKPHQFSLVQVEDLGLPGLFIDKIIC